MTREALLRKRHRQNCWVKSQREQVELEASLEKRVVERLESERYCILLKVGKEGWPDRLVLLGEGRHCWFEFKRRKFGSLTPAQRVRLRQLKRRGEGVYVIKSMEQAEEAVRHERSRLCECT